MYTVAEAQMRKRKAPMKTTTTPKASLVVRLDVAIAFGTSESMTLALSTLLPAFCVVTRAQPDLCR